MKIVLLGMVVVILILNLLIMGEKLKHPIKYNNIKFITGSGVTGCDRYDGGYDNGVHYDTEKYIPDSYLSNFVVCNEIEEYDDDIDEDEESEFDFDDRSSE